MLYTYLVSLVRTVAPIAAGWLITQALRLGVHLDDATAVSALTGAFAAVYYGLFRWAEQRASARFGWLLGVARPPQYPARDGGTLAPAPTVGGRP
jgi:hypothetical protein